MLFVKNIGKKLPDGRALLKDISFTAKKGEFIGVMGESGVGKTVLLRCINGLTTPDRGEVSLYCNGHHSKINGKKGQELRTLQRHIGMIFQGSNLVKRLSVLENVLTGRLGRISPLRSLVYGFTDEEAKIALDALARVGIKHLAARRAETLSGGEMQRVAIARALFQEPQLLLADEPVANLDPKNTELVLENLVPLAREMAIVGVFHSPQIVRDYCTRAVAIKDGVVFYDGKPDVPASTLEQIFGYEKLAQPEFVA